MTNREATETETLSDTARPPSFTGQDAARIVASLGADTRPSFKLKGLNGKPLKIPKLEETIYLVYLELGLIRNELTLMRHLKQNQGSR